MDDNFMSSPLANSVTGFITGLNIIAEHLSEGLETKGFLGAEHDVIHFYLDNEALPEDSDAGRELDSLGFHYDEDAESWAFFT